MRVINATQRARLCAPAESRRSARVLAAAAAFALGALLVFAVGLASPSALHDAAHDVRHVLSFPCH
jgi:cobalt transporter subunit CbtB